MGNFFQDVGRSTLSQNIGELIRNKVTLDTNERAGVQQGQQSAINAEQLEVVKRQNKNAAEKDAHDNTPLPVDVLADSIEGGPDGPIYKYLYGKFKAMGYINDTNPENVTVLRKHANEYGAQVFKENSREINNIRISWLNQNKQAILQELQKKPGDEKLLAQLEDINTKKTQASTMDEGLRKDAELKQKAEEARVKEAGLNTRAAAEEAGRNKRAAEDNTNRLDAARIKLLDDIKNNPDIKMTKDEKWAVDFLKTYKETSSPNPIMAMLAAQGGAESPAAKALQSQTSQTLSPETQSKVAKAQAIVDKMLKKNNPELFEEPSSNLPGNVTEEDIQHTMKLHNVSREEVLKRVKGAQK